MAHPWYLNKTVFKLSSVRRKHDQSHRIINEFADEIINKRMADLNRNDGVDKRTTTTDDDGEDRKPKSFIEILLETRSEMSHEQMRDELITVMIGK